MVQCQYCSVHLPKPEAIAKEDRFYCSQKHLNALDEKGWLGGAHWRPSPNQDARPEGMAPDLMVIHHISLPPGGFADRNSTSFIVDFFQNRLDSSLHPYFEEIAAGLSSFLGREKCNDFSIGVELEGDGERPFEEIQYQALAGLTAQIQDAYPNLLFAGHSDIAPNRKTDPGAQFNWEKFQSRASISSEKFPFGLRSR
ncbi:MAG: N-acetylmuramoyl-L-alanine amidase [Polynucleobacter sp. 35-46-207]|nr:MAG: N-acetylmuramoyl-L-alanine amidase [Polynucleobacter sp. 35-46-207]